jgi:hypothetical protein
MADKAALRESKIFTPLMVVLPVYLVFGNYPPIKKSLSVKRNDT